MNAAMREEGPSSLRLLKRSLSALLASCLVTMNTSVIPCFTVPIDLPPLNVTTAGARIWSGPNKGRVSIPRGKQWHRSPVPVEMWMWQRG